MNIWEDIKSCFKKSTKKVLEVSEDLVKKGKETGSEGLDSIQDFLDQVGEKTSEVTSVLKLKIEISSLQKKIEQESLVLGTMLLKQKRSKKTDLNNTNLQEQLDNMLELDQQIQTLNNNYDQVRKELSSDYVVGKLSDDLYASGAIIEQVIVSEDANVVDKMLKEIVLPKEALISAIKRGNVMIIPDGNTKIQAGDQITIIGKTEDVEKVYKRFTSD